MNFLSDMLGVKTQREVTTLKEIENRDLLYISYDENIPSSVRGVTVSLNIDSNGHVDYTIGHNEIHDPSTIYVHLPVSDNYNVLPLPYWPNYIDLSPGQRYLYLNWLRNVDLPVDIGYVFLYYYGLERHLLIGNFEKAFSQIIRLRNIHKNKSFLSHSESALIHSCIMRDRLDMLLDLHEKTEISGFSNARFLLAYNLKFDLLAQNLIEIIWKAFTLSRKAIKENRAKFEQLIIDVLIGKYGTDTFPIKNYDISKATLITEERFCNYSFPKEIRQVEITDFYQCRGLMHDVELIFKLAYERYKQQAATERKIHTSNKTEEEIRTDNMRKNTIRYNKLLSDKKITQGEFDLLTVHNQTNNI